jgi:hypothetical protein
MWRSHIFIDSQDWGAIFVSVKQEPIMNQLVAYVGKTEIASGTRTLTDWHGNKIGVCRMPRSWRVNSYIGNRMYQIYASVDGVEYTGRGFGEGMVVVLRPTAKQRRAV